MLSRMVQAPEAQSRSEATSKTAHLYTLSMPQVVMQSPWEAIAAMTTIWVQACFPSKPKRHEPSGDRSRARYDASVDTLMCSMGRGCPTTMEAT
jgi:hypothetical protein